MSSGPTSQGQPRRWARTGPRSGARPRAGPWDARVPVLLMLALTAVLLVPPASSHPIAGPLGGSAPAVPPAPGIGPTMPWPTSGAAPAVIAGAPPRGFSAAVAPTEPGASLIATTPSGDNPGIPAFDASDGDLYFPDYGSAALGGNNVTIISGTTNKVVANVPVGDDPLSAIYDPVHSYVYITNFGLSQNVTVLQGTAVVAWVGVGNAPDGGVFDPSNGYVYITCFSSGNVTVLDGTVVVTSIKVGQNPEPPAFDPITSEVYVPNKGSDTVTVLKGTTVVGTVPVGSQPNSATFDSSDGHVYVPNAGGSNVSVLAGTTLLGNVSTGAAPWSAAFDSANSDVYVPCTGSDQISVISTNLSVTNLTGGTTPREGVYDGTTGLVYVTNWDSNNVTVINGTTIVASIAVGQAPFDVIEDPSTGVAYVSDYDSDHVSAIGFNRSAYSVTFSETGLPGGSEWAAQFGATTVFDTNASITFTSPNGTFNYSVRPIAGFEVNETGRVTVNGTSVVVNITFRALFGIRFLESGLPNGTAWNITLGSTARNSTTPTLDFSEPNGTYAYAIQPIAGYSTTWSGQLSVVGTAQNVSVTFTQVTYALTFSETGLPIGTPWSVLLGSTPLATTASSVSQAEPNGSYRYVFRPVAGFLAPPGGTIDLSGTGSTIVGDFHELFPVRFVTRGLPAGTNWSVTVGGSTNSTSSTSMTIPLTNGTFAYSVGALPGYWASGPGNVTVDGTGTTVTVTFTAVFPIAFAEIGLPGGTAWSVTIGPTTNRSSSASITLIEPNGTYDYALGGVPGYETSGPTDVSISGHGIAVSIRFTAIYPVTFRAAGLPSGTPWTASVGSASNTSTSNEITLEATNGSHPYTITPIPGWRAFWSGSVDVHGGPATVPVGFSVNTYPVTFRETGLVDNASWSVDLNGSVRSSATSGLTFDEPNGTYGYTVASILGYSGGASGSVRVDGAAPAPVAVVYEPAGQPSTGIRTTTAIEVGALAAGVAVIAAVVLLVRRRRGGRPGPGGAGPAPAEPGPARAAEPEPTGGGPDPPADPASGP